MNINLSCWVSAPEAEAADGKYTGEVCQIIYGRAQAHVGETPGWNLSLGKQCKKVIFMEA